MITKTSNSLINQAIFKPKGLSSFRRLFKDRTQGKRMAMAKAILRGLSQGAVIGGALYGGSSLVHKLTDKPKQTPNSF